MVSIHDADVNMFIGDDILGGTSAWIGLSRVSSSAEWAWTDESAFDYSWWFGEDPDCGWGDCAATNYLIWGTWCRRSCSDEAFYFACQISAS